MSTAPVPRREDILVALRNSKSLLDSFGVAHVSLFGSFARDEAREDSDVDVLVEFARPIGMFDFVRLQRELGERIGRKVELVTPRRAEAAASRSDPRRGGACRLESGGCASRTSSMQSPKSSDTSKA